ncbi:MAG: SemiSWEET transporter [Thermodesulfobacteriota bacterium]
MSNIDLIGYSAAILTTAAFLPQAIKVLKTKDTKSLSLAMFLIFTLGLFFWIIYGILREDKAIIIANSVTGILSLLILTTKLRLEVFSKKRLQNKTT